VIDKIMVKYHLLNNKDTINIKKIHKAKKKEVAKNKKRKKLPQKKHKT